MMTGGKKLHTENERTYQEKKDLAKLALGAASVMVGTGLYAGHAAGVKADTNNTSAANDQAEQQNDVQQTGVRATADQTQQVQTDAQQGSAAANQATGQAIQINNGSATPQNGPVHATPASEPAQQAGKEIDSNDYETGNLSVVANNGLTADTHGRVALTAQLRFSDPTKINNGDYLDIKLGAPTTDGKYVDYASSLMPDQDIILTNQDNQQVKVGEIHQMDAGTNTAYYRLIFNDQLKTFISPTINLQLLWNSMIQSGVMLRLYTQQAGQASLVTLMNDLKIGSDVTTAWIQVPVIYVPSSGRTQQTFNMAQAGYNAEHIWTTDVDGHQQLSVHGMNETVNVWLADQLSNKVTVTIHGLADNPYFDTSYMTGDQVAQQIENAIKQQGKTITLGDKVARHPELSFGAAAQDSGEQVPKVTVTRTPGTDSMAYQITVDSNQPVSIGNTPIVFATVQNKPGILPDPASTIKTYHDDMQSVSQVAGQATPTVSYGGGYIASHTYKGPQLANQQMQDFMNHHLAAYVAIHDDANNSNNNGHTGNAPFLGLDPLADAGPINFAFNIADQNTVNGKAQQNVSDGIGVQTGTVPATDSRAVTETIHYQYANGNQAAPDNVQTVSFSRQGTKQLLGGTYQWQAWTPASGSWATVTSPTITGYTPTLATVNGQTVTPDTHDTVVTVIYNKNIELGQVTLNFVDQDDNNRVISSKQFSGEAGSDTHYNTKADLRNFLNAHYVLASDPTNGQNVKINAGQPQTITIALKHATNNIQDSKDVVETIHYQYADGTQAHADSTQEVKFNRTGTRDLVTNSDNWQAWTPASGSWTAVTSPTIAGYTPSQAIVAGKTVTATTPNADITVTYTKGNEPSKLGQVTINFVDQDDNDRIISSKQLSGQVGANSKYNTKADIDALINRHYVLSNDETKGQDVIIADGQPTYTVLLKHGSKQVQDAKTITETIHYQYIDGTPAATDHVATIQFTRHGVQDEVNGNDTWDPWTADSHSFAAVDSPVLDGYTAHPATVAARTVNSDTPSQEITVVYLKKDNGNSGDNNGNKGNQQPGQPGQPTQPGNNNPSGGQNTQPGNDHGSTSQPTTNQPSANQPAIDESLVSGGQHNSDDQGYVQTGATYNGSTMQAGQVNAQTPTGYQWETLHVLVPNSTNNQQRLPQTGNAQRQMGFAATLLAAVLGIFGISLTGFNKNRDN